jgi:uroporphyrinogen decarboxylase
MCIRDLILSALTSKVTERIPIIQIEGVERKTLHRWYREGLSEGIDLDSHFGLDFSLGGANSTMIPINNWILPHFFPRTISEDERYFIKTDSDGRKVKILKDNPTMVSSWIDYPIKSRNDWDRMKYRFDSTDLRRFPPYDWDEYLEYCKETSDIVGVMVHPYLFRFGQFLMGTKRFLMSFFKDPGLVHDMFKYYSEFLFNLYKDWIGKTRIDFAVFAEDLAYKHGTHISPRTYREFWLPYEKKLLNLFKSKGVKIIVLWSSGNILPLMSLFLEAGFNCFWPLEVAAGVNAVDLKEEYGEKVLLIGNISKEALINGKKHIEKEVTSKVSYLIEKGGYIPAVDDIIPPEVPLYNYRYYLDLLRKIKL